MLEPSTGKVLAMVSKPDFDPNTIEQDWDALINDDSNSSLFNRALQGQYPPGSTFKILTTLEYIREHPDSYTYRHSYDNHIAHSNTFFITDDFVDQSQFLRSRSMQSIRFNPDNTIGKTPVFQIYCHRTTDQSNSYYSNLHINISFYPTFTTASTPRTMFKMTHM